LLQKTENIYPPHQFATANEYQRAKNSRADLLRKEMETWHVQQQQQTENGGGHGGGGGGHGGHGGHGGNGGEEVEVSDARKRYLNQQRMELETVEKQRQEEHGGGHEGGVYAVGDPYKEDLPAAMKNNSRASPTGKKRKKKKKTTTGRRTIFG
jgi:hypothetical protein